jgi:copper(I)-binding protein
MRSAAAAAAAATTKTAAAPATEIEEPPPKGATPGAQKSRVFFQVGLSGSPSVELVRESGECAGRFRCA